MDGTSSTASRGYALVVVAIPSDDDYVWRISSEKVPHLTLLYLGKQELGPQTARVVEFVEHVAETSLCRFGLEVERRGTLGDEGADVLFFGKHGLKKIQDARTFMLANSDISTLYNSTLYNSTEQYPSWTPHLTLGYPETPAKPDLRDYPGTTWVNFDRIAVWTGDYDGPEFQLKNENYAVEEVAMSSLSGPRGELGAAAVKELLHYGIPGMKWGRRRTDSELAVARTSSAEEGKSSSSAPSVKVGKTSVSSLSNTELQAVVNRIRLEQEFARLTAIPEQKSMLQAGRDFAKGLVKDIAKENVTKLAKAQATHQLANHLAKKKGKEHLVEALVGGKKKKK